MDPREKREDETWAEYGARMASIGIAPVDTMLAGGFPNIPAFPSWGDFAPDVKDYAKDKGWVTPGGFGSYFLDPTKDLNLLPDVPPGGQYHSAVEEGMGAVPAGISVVEEQVIPKTGHFGISQNYGDFSPQMGMLGDMVTDQPPMVDFSVVTDDPSRPVDYSQVFTENMPTATLPAETELQIMDSPMPNVQPVQTQDTGMIPVTYTETTDTGEVVPMSNENLSFFGAAPVPTSPSMNVDYSQALADAGMATVPTLPGRTPQSGAPETPAAYTGELDRYGLSGWTPELPEVTHPLDISGITQPGIDYWGDIISNTFDSPIVDKVYDVLTTPGFKSIPSVIGYGVLDQPMMDRKLEEAIIEKAKTAPKGNLERIAAAKAAQDKEKARMRDLAAQQRKDELERQKAAAKAKRDAAKRVAELTRQAAARQAQAAREVQASKDRVRQANAIMNSRDYQEGGIGNLSAAQRDILAAAQVDTFAEISDPAQSVRDAMTEVGYGGFGPGGGGWT